MKLPRIIKFSRAETNLFSQIGMVPQKIPQHDYLGFNFAVTKLMTWFSNEFGDQIRVPPTRIEKMSPQLKLKFQGSRLKYQFPGKSKPQRFVRAEWNCLYNALHVAITPNCSLNSWNGLRYSTHRSYDAMDPFVLKAFKLYDVDLLNETRGWSKQQATREELSTMVMDYFCKDSKSAPRKGSKSAKAYAKAIDIVKQRWKVKNGVVPLNLKTALKFIHRDTSPGYSFHGQKTKNIIPEILHAARKLEDQFWKAPKDRTITPPPCKLGSRGHLSPWDDRKLRLIWIYPAELKLIELCFSAPLTAAYLDKSEKNPEFPMLIGNRIIGRIADVCYKEYDNCSAIRTDFSGWDYNIPDWVIKTAFEVLFSNFDLDKWLYHKPKSKKNADLHLHRIMEALCHYFINTPFCTPYGVIGRKRNGKVPSGSCFTSLIDSVGQDLVNTTADIMLGLVEKTIKLDRHPSGWRMQYIRSLVVGDDGHRVYPDDVLIGKGWTKWCKFKNKWVADLSQYACAFGRLTRNVFGETLNLKKTEYNDGGIQNGIRTFLGYTFKAWRLHRETDEWLKMALFAEKAVPDVYTSTTRMLAFWSLGGEYDIHFCGLWHTFLEQLEFDIERPLYPEYRLKKMVRRLFGDHHPLLQKSLCIKDINIFDYHNLHFRHRSRLKQGSKFKIVMNTRQMAIEKLKPTDLENPTLEKADILEVEDYLDDVIANKGHHLMDLRHLDLG